MKKNFEECFEFVLKEEGPMTNDPHDPGGLTKFGIAKTSHPDVDVAGLTKHGAELIYRKDYWAPCRCDDLPSGLDLITFDFAVNVGCLRAKETLQRAVGAKVDGVVGPMTLERVRMTNTGYAVDGFWKARRAFYMGRSGFSRYGKGWLARTDRCREAAHFMVNEGGE